MNNLAWLVDQLTQAEANGELVHIINHIPPGNPDCLGAWGREFSEIVDRYNNGFITNRVITKLWSGRKQRRLTIARSWVTRILDGSGVKATQV